MFLYDNKIAFEGYKDLHAINELEKIFNQICKDEIFTCYGKVEQYNDEHTRKTLKCFNCPFYREVEYGQSCLICELSVVIGEFISIRNKNKNNESED